MTLLRKVTPYSVVGSSFSFVKDHCMRFEVLTAVNIPASILMLHFEKNKFADFLNISAPDFLVIVPFY
jgi:hypothetical protein